MSFRHQYAELDVVKPNCNKSVNSRIDELCVPKLGLSFSFCNDLHCEFFLHVVNYKR